MGVLILNQFDETMKFNVEDTQAHDVKEILANV